jgi:hypothetical protein
MWSSSSVKRVFRIIEKEMMTEIKYTLIHDQNAKGQIMDGIKFDTRQLFIFLIRHFGLSEEANKRSVQIVLTLDDAPLDDTTGQSSMKMMMGRSFIQARTVFPLAWC